MQAARISLAFVCLSQAARAGVPRGAYGSPIGHDDKGRVVPTMWIYDDLAVIAG